MKIYTRAGDQGETGLWGGGRVGKDHTRVQAYGCVYGVVLATGMRRPMDLVGALLAARPERAPKLGRHAGPPPKATARLEAEIDGWTADLEPLKHFILPGGAVAGASLHLARTICRRAEREVVALSRREKIPASIVVYLNRLSDHLYTAARWVNQKLGVPETPWEGLAGRYKSGR